MASRLARRLVFDKYPQASILAAAPLTLQDLARRPGNPALGALMVTYRSLDKTVRRKEVLERVGIELPTEAIGLPRNLRTVVVDRRRQCIVAEG